MTVVIDPIEAYEVLLSKREIRVDQNQKKAIQLLQSLHLELGLYGEQMGQTGWRALLRATRPPV